MRFSISRTGMSLGNARYVPSRSHAVPLLQAFALAMMVMPSDTVIKAIGAEGYPSNLIGMAAFAGFVAATLFGFHDPLQHRHPIRAVLCLLWLSALASYVAMDRPSLTVAQAASADRLPMKLAAMTGVALVAAECLTSLRDVRRVLRALVWGGAFCGVVAALQFWMSVDITPNLRLLPGFTQNFDTPAIVARGALNRAAGTSSTAIELGVVAGMLLPLAIYLAMYDTDRSIRKRCIPVALIALAIPASVSRSTVISLVLSLAVLIVLMPTPERLYTLCVVPLALAAIFMSAHGLIGTLTTFFEAGQSDDSVKARVIDYPVAEELTRQAPLLGHGGGTYLPENPMYILDNQYLKTAIELGLVGVVALVALFLVSVIAALVARRNSSDPELRLLCAALAGPALAAGACSVTFDSLAFPMFSNLFALVIGMIGASWRLAVEAREPIFANTYQTRRKPAFVTQPVHSARG